MLQLGSGDGATLARAQARLVDESLEAAALCALIKGARVDAASVPPETFTHEVSRAVFSAIQTTAQRLKRTVVDVPLVRAELLQRSASAECIEFLELLPSLDGEPARLDAYLQVLTDLTIRRAALKTLGDAVGAIIDRSRPYHSTVSGLTATLSKNVSAGGEGLGGDMGRTLMTSILSTIETAEASGAQQQAFLGIPIPGFMGGSDGLRGFPCRPKASAIGVIAARSGNGKTALLATLLHHWMCDLGMKVGLVGLEDGVEWLIDRWASRDLGLDWGAIRGEVPREDFIFPDGGQMKWAAREWWQPHPKSGELCMGLADVVECYTSALDQRLMQYSGVNITSPHLVALVRKWIAAGAKAVVVDHGLKVDYAPGQNERMDLAIKRGLESLNEVTMDTGVPIVLAWHLNRKNDDDTPPTMSDIKESGYLDSVAALVLGAWRQGGTGRTLCNVIKSRKSGGIGRVAELYWSGRSGMFQLDKCEAVDLGAEARAARANKQNKRNEDF